MAPVIEAGGPNPVTALPGHTPASPLTLVAVPATLVTVDPPRMPKLQAAPKLIGGAAHGVEVVKVHTKLAASVLPNVSLAPVVIVAVKVVLAARALEGVKVAMLVAEA
jgi:hypothetical protein